MKAYEAKKEGVGQRGIIQMSIKGKAEEVRKVEAILNTNDLFTNDLCDDEDEDGTLEIGYYVDRNDKAEFMAAYKAAKAAIAK